MPAHLYPLSLSEKQSKSIVCGSSRSKSVSSGAKPLGASARSSPLPSLVEKQTCVAGMDMSSRKNESAPPSTLRRSVKTNEASKMSAPPTTLKESRAHVQVDAMGERVARNSVSNLFLHLELTGWCVCGSVVSLWLR